MKNILIIAFFAISIASTAQQTIPMAMDYTNYLENNNYIKDFDLDLDKFVGTWKWTSPTNPNTFFEINFFKVLRWNPNRLINYYEDKILGNYKYVDNGVVITNTLTWNTTDDLYSTTFPAIIGNDVKPLFRKLLISMRDVEKRKTCDANFNIIDLNASPLTATWKLISTDQIRIGVNLPHVQQGFSIPTDIILIKQ
jgi:hypothetical protein